MWFFIFIGMGAAALAVLFYLIGRFSRFAFVDRLSGGKKLRKAGIAAALVIAVVLICAALFDVINTVIILIHLGVIWLICDGFCRLLEKRGIRWKKGYFAGFLAIVITVGYLGCGWYLDHHVWEKDYVIASDKKVGDLRIVLFSDSHVGTTFDGGGFAGLARRMQETDPDVVIIAGDYVDDDTSLEDMTACCEALGSLQTTFGVYYAFGNHDKGYYGSEYRGYSGGDLVRELEKNGVRVLQDEIVPVDDRFYIIGRQDRSEEQMDGSRASMEELMSGLDEERFSIVIDHQPHDYAAQEACGADLVLSGHTHGGQLFPINYLGEWTKANEKTYGLEKRGNTSFIVTSGISDWAIKFKTGCRSEFVVIDIQGEKQAAEK